MWAVITYITTPISLIALILLIVFYLKKAKINADLELLKNIDSKDKVKLLPILEDKYAYNVSNLTKEQRYDLAKSQLLDLAKKRRDQLYFFSFIAILVLIFLILSLFKNSTSSTTSERNTDSVNVVTVSKNPLSFNIVDSSKSIKLIFISRTLSLSDTVCFPASLTLNELKNSIITAHKLESIIRKKYPGIWRINWTLNYENLNVPDTAMKLKIQDMSWKNLDHIQLIFTTESVPSPIKKISDLDTTVDKFDYLLSNARFIDEENPEISYLLISAKGDSEFQVIGKVNDFDINTTAMRHGLTLEFFGEKISGRLWLNSDCTRLTGKLLSAKKSFLGLGTKKSYVINYRRIK